MKYEGIRKVLLHWIPEWKIRRPSSGNMYVPCPLAKWTHAPKPGRKYGSDSSGSMSIKVGPGRSKWKCWACHKAGNDLDSLIKQRAYYEGVNYDHLVALTKETDFTEFDDVFGFFEEIEEVIVPKVNEEYLSKFPKLTSWERFEDKTVIEYGIRYDKEKNRIVLPVCKPDGTVVGAQGRAVADGQNPKYYNYENFQKGRCLFGIQVGEGSTVVLTEGPTDAMKVYEATGLTGAAMMGSSLSTSQAKLLRENEEVILALDFDAAGSKGANVAAALLMSDMTVKVVNWPPIHEAFCRWWEENKGDEPRPKTDPGSLPPHLVKRMIDEALLVV